MRLTVDYCFKNDNAQTGYTRGTLTYPLNPRKELSYEVERVLKAAEDKEKKPVILVGYITFGS